MMASTFSNAAVKSLRIECADFLRPEVIGVVVAAAEDVGAEDDAALDFRAEAFLAGPCHNVEQVCRVRRAMAVADAVKAREIRGGFRCGDDVIDADGVFGVRQGDLDDFRAERFVVLRWRRARACPPAGRCLSMKYSFGMPRRTPFRSRPSCAV